MSHILQMLSGYPVTDIKVILTDGKMHSVDSNDFAFTAAGRLAVKHALSKAGTSLLQPMEKVTFTANKNLQGDITGIVSRNNGYVTGSDVDTGEEVQVEACLPSCSIPEVSNLLRSKSGGSSSFLSEFSHYQVVNDEVVIKNVVEQSPHRHE
jgi:elongation factor G